MTLCAQVVDFIGLNLLQYAREIARIRQIAVMQHEVSLPFVRVLVKVIDSLGVERRSTSLYSMNLITLLNEKLSEV